MKKTNKKQNIKLPRYDFGGQETGEDPYRFGNYSQQNLSSMDNNSQSSGGGGMGASGWGQLGMIGANMGMQMMANKQQGQAQGQNPYMTPQQSQYSKETQQFNTMNSAADQGISKIPGFGQFYGLAKAGEGVGKSMVNKDANGNPINNNNQIAANFINSTHEQVLNDVAHKKYGYALADAFVNKGVGSMAVGVIGTHNPLGRSINKWATSNNNPNEDGSQPTPESDGLIGGLNKRNKQNNFGFNSHMRQGGIQGFYAEGGLQPNAEIEKQENFITPQCDFGQANGPSHEQGGVDVNIPGGTIIFSDKLKPKGSKKTYAQLNKKNDTTKESELLEDKNSTSESKKSTQLMLSIKQKNSSTLFQAQEEAKQLRLNNYIKRLGGVQKYPGGGTTPTGPNYQAWSNQNSLRGYQSPSDQPGMMYNPANYNYQYYDPNKSYIPQVRPEIDPNHKPMQFGPNMNYNPNNNQYINPQGQEIRQSNFKFGIGGAFNSNIQDATNYANNPPSSQSWQSGESSYDPNVQQFYNQGPNSNYQVNYPGNRFNKYDNVNSAVNYANKGNPNKEVDDMFDTGSYAGDSATKGPVVNNKSINNNWKDAAYYGAGTLAQSAGQLAYLKEQGKKYDTQKFHQYNPSTLNDASAIAEARRQANAVNASLAGGAGGSANNYMANRIQAGQANTDNLAKIRMEYENANAGIKNQAGMFNNQNQYMVDDRNAHNKGQALSNYYNTLGSVGNNVASGMRDYRADGYDKQKMNMLSSTYNNPEFQNNFYKSQGYKFHPVTGEPIK